MSVVDSGIEMVQAWLRENLHEIATATGLKLELQSRSEEAMNRWRYDELGSSANVPTQTTSGSQILVTALPPDAEVGDLLEVFTVDQAMRGILGRNRGERTPASHWIVIARSFSDESLSFIRSFNDNLESAPAAFAIESRGLDAIGDGPMGLTVVVEPSSVATEIMLEGSSRLRAELWSEPDFLDAVRNTEQRDFLNSFIFGLKDTGGEVRWGHKDDRDAFPLFFGFLESPIAFRLSPAGDLEVRGCWNDWPHVGTRTPFGPIADALGVVVKDHPAWQYVNPRNHDVLFELAMDCVCELIDLCLADDEHQRSRQDTLSSSREGPLLSRSSMNS